MNKSFPLISIVLPVFNGEKYLSQSIESCLNQSYDNIELIIVNDCSTDGTLDIVNRYASVDKRIIVINNKENKKLPASLNIGHHIAAGDFITWTSDDNFYELNALEELYNSLLKNKADIVYSDIVLIDNTGSKVRDIYFLGIENIIFGNFIGSCFLYKKEVYQRNNGYNENLFLIEDYDFWLRAISHSYFYHVKKRLYNYRKHGASLTNQIRVDIQINRLFSENVGKMYFDFCKTILEEESNEISNLFLNILTHQKISFGWVVNHNTEIQKFKSKLIENQNFISLTLLEKVFLKKIIEIMVVDRQNNFNFSNLLFLIKKYFRFLEKNDVKTLIKYSFFKKNK